MSIIPHSGERVNRMGSVTRSDELACLAINQIVKQKGWRRSSGSNAIRKEKDKYGWWYFFVQFRELNASSTREISTIARIRIFRDNSKYEKCYIFLYQIGHGNTHLANLLPFEKYEFKDTNELDISNEPDEVCMMSVPEVLEKLKGLEPLVYAQGIDEE